MSAEMKVMRRMAKYAWQDYKRMKIFYQNSKFTQPLKKFRSTEINGYIKFREWTKTDYYTKV
jgi:hypothetical protein